MITDNNDNVLYYNYIIHISIITGPVADKGLRNWVYQAQAYERTGLRMRAGFTSPPNK